jgi:hypothetical protein
MVADTAMMDKNSAGTLFFSPFLRTCHFKIGQSQAQAMRIYHASFWQKCDVIASYGR